MRWLPVLAASLLVAGCAGQTVAAPQVRTSSSNQTPLATISGLLRGHSVQVPLTINNPQGESIRVVEISMRARQVSKARCPLDALVLANYPRPIIGAQASGVILLTLELPASAPRVCDGSTWDVEFASRAEIGS